MTHLRIGGRPRRTAPARTLIRVCGPLAVLVVLLTPGPSWSVVYRLPTDEVLVSRSSVIAFGTVLHAAPGPAAGFPTTDFTFRVEETLKGAVPGGAIVVRQTGGVAPDGAVGAIMGLRRLREGDRVLLFLDPAGDGNEPAGPPVHRIVGLGLGVFFEAVHDGRLLLEREAGLRAISESKEEGGLAGAFAAPMARDAVGFRRWIEDRVAGLARPAEYFVPGRAERPAMVASPFKLLRTYYECAERYLPLRWPRFDRGERLELVVASDAMDSAAGRMGMRSLQPAMHAWNRDVRSRVRMAVGDRSSEELPFDKRDGITSITFEDPLDELPGDVETHSVLAAATVYWDCKPPHAVPDGGGTRAYALVEANVTTQDGLWESLRHGEAPLKNYQEILAHELGHVLGIDHSCTYAACDPHAREAIMRPWVHEDGRGADLTADDLLAVRALYPRVESTLVDSTCQADDESLCLNHGRFRVTGEWSTGGAGARAGAVTLTADTGFFWFFDPANVEVVAKVLDGCGVNGHVWVFAAGLTDVRVALIVEDVSGRFGRRVYEHKGAAAFEPILDATAFPCGNGAGDSNEEGR